jgi:hypothetical protein
MKQRIRYVRVSTGVYMYIKKANKAGVIESGNTYRVLKTVNGRRIEDYFTNKTKAIKFYKSI